MKKILLLPLIIFTVSQSAFGYFFKAEEWRSEDQTILLFNDLHRKTAENISVEQRQNIVNLATSLNAGLIVEDSYFIAEDQLQDSTADISYTVATQAQINAKPIFSPLSGLYSLSKLNGIDARNVECRLSWYGPLSVYYQFCQNKKNQLYNCNDGNEPIYTECLNELEKSLEKPLANIFDLMKTTNLKKEDFTKQTNLPVIADIDSIFIDVFENKYDHMAYTYERKLNLLLLAHAAKFVDLEIIRAITLLKNKSIIIICAGDAHIEFIKKILPELQFRHYKTIGESLKVDGDKKNSEPTALDFNAIAQADQQITNTISLVLFEPVKTLLGLILNLLGASKI